MVYQADLAAGSWYQCAGYVADWLGRMGAGGAHRPTRDAGALRPYFLDRSFAGWRSLPAYGCLRAGAWTGDYVRADLYVSGHAGRRTRGQALYPLAANTA